MREVERQVMLRIIDQRWREHLEEMDYLKEGINLRAMGQKDPLVEWQREGFEMFGGMMKGIAQDFVAYVMHVQVERAGRAAQARAAGDQPADLVERRRARSSSGFDRAAAQAAAEGDVPDGAPAAGRSRRHVEAADGRQGRLREDAAQRAVPVRVGQEVQAVPRRSLTGPCHA